MNETLLAVKAFFAFLVSLPEVKFLVGHVTINTVVAIAASLREGDFDLRKVGCFLRDKLLPYVAVYAVVRLAGEASGLTWIMPVAWTAVTTNLTGDLLDSLAKLGLPIPNAILSVVGLDN